MRGSPISKIRNRQDYSPYQSNPRHSSPGTNQNSPVRNPPPYLPGDGSEWRYRVRQLESELVAVNQQLLFHIRKSEKIDDLQEKIQLLLAQNTHFVDENENLIKLVQQKNSEIQVWKRKFDSEYTNSNMAEVEKRKIFDHLNIKDTEHQIQIEKLLAEITRLQNEAVDADNLKKLEIHRLKNQYESESIAQIQNLRRSQNGNNEIQELNIRKLRDEIEEKNFEIENLNRQIRLKNEELKSEAAYSKNQLKKLEEQKSHEIDLLKTENENVKSNLTRQHRKNEDQLRNLHQAKVKRLTYEIEQKRHEIEEGNNRLKRTGKEGESEIARLINDNSSLRNQLKDNDNRNRTRIQELTAYYDSQFAQERETNQQRQTNLRNYYDNDIAILQAIIAAKEEEIRRILDINKQLKRSEQHRLQLIKQNNFELKHKIEEIVKHYEREIELTKIKIAQLYEADLESLRNQLQNSYANHALEVEGLRNLIEETRGKLASQVQARLDQRTDYELRLVQIAQSHDNLQRELKNVIKQREKEIEGHTSKASLTQIQHTQLLQTRNINMKQVIAQKRNLQKLIDNKNREIEALNLKVQQMLGLHKRDIEKLEEQLDQSKKEHQSWLDRQERETNEWHADRKDLSGRIDDLNNRNAELKRKNQEREAKLTESVNQKGLQIGRLNGQIEQLQARIRQLTSRGQVEVQNVERTVLQARTLMNTEKERLLETAARQKNLTVDEGRRVRQSLQNQIADLKRENEILQDNYQLMLIRQQQLKNDVRGLTDSVNRRGKLQQSVINIGLSNNYFKNVAQIFKRQLAH